MRESTSSDEPGRREKAGGEAADAGNASEARGGVATPSVAREVRKRLLGGGSLVLGADALQGPLAVVVIAYLGRRLGLEGLALYLLAASVATWIELATRALFSRATVQLVGEAEEWRPVASMLVRWHLALSVAMGGLLFLGAGGIAQLLGVEGLAPLLQLFALEAPVSAAAGAHTQVLVGLGRFRARAACSVGRSVARVVLVATLVETGFGVRGAVLASIASAVIELAIARGFVRPPLLSPTPAGLGRRLMGYSLPLFANGMALQLFHRLGLLLLVPLGASLTAAGLYGAAQDLLRIRRVLGQSLTPLLLSSLTRLRRGGEIEASRELARDALSWCFYPMPVVATLAGAAGGLMELIFGASFEQGGPVLALLLTSVPSLILISVTTAVLISEGRPQTPVKLSAPTVAAAALGMVWAVPRAGALGAAATSATCAAGCAAAAVFVVARGLGVAPRWRTVGRSVLASCAAWLAAWAAPYGGWWLLIELPAIALAALGLLVALGEQRARVAGSLGRAASALRRQRRA